MKLIKDLRTKTQKRAAAHLDKRPRKTISFYRYVKISDPNLFREQLNKKLTALDCFGRIYIAKEGINAQMNVPVENWAEFDLGIQSLPELLDIPFKIAVEESDLMSFYKLTIKVKDKIVADGLEDTTFDVTNTGEYLTAEEMNEYVNDSEALVVDMRNAYESEVGHFKGAIKPNVDTFREELKIVPELLKIHKNKKIALYCTGGIRCEKASAWLKHKGFTNVRHLRGGIIDYKHQIETKKLENSFLGKNFVFDARLGEKIGEEVISRCHLCDKAKSDKHYHCKNQICHVLYLGCDDCLKQKQGYCRRWCILTDKLPTKFKKLFARYYNKYFRAGQFKKARLRSS